jgi:hypothetical protein
MFKRNAHRLAASLLLCLVAIVYFSPSFAGGTYTQNFANGTANCDACAAGHLEQLHVAQDQWDSSTGG